MPCSPWQLGVRQLCLPAAPEAVDTWIRGFGFSHMPQDEQGHPVDTPELDAIEDHDRKGLAELQRDFDRALLFGSG